MITPLDAVAPYRAAGIVVLPAPWQKKMPTVPWKEYQTRQPTEAEYEKWFGSVSLSNYWALCGSSSRLVGLDADSPAGEQWAATTVGRDYLDSTTTVKTSRGYHWWFRTPVDAVLKSWNQDGIEFHGEGTGLVAPPSMHERGVQYTFVRGLDCLQDLPEVLFSAPSSPNKSANDRPATPGRGEGLAALLGAPVGEGKRNDWLTKVAGHYAKQTDYEDGYMQSVRVANGTLRPPLADDEWRALAASIWSAEKGKATRPSGARLVRMSDVQPEQVRWLWPSRVPLGKLTLLIGDPGLMKSTLTLFMAAQVTNGGAWPDCVALAGDAHAPQGDAVLLTAEDGLSDTVRPRLDELGADVGRVWVLEAVAEPKEGGERSFNLRNDLSELERVITEKDARLVVIDPLNAYTSGTDSHKAAEVRQAMTPLAAMAERCGVAVVLVHHLNKGNDDVNALYRASGSLDYVAVARSVLGVAPDPDEEGRILLVPVKLNIAQKPEGLGFRRGDEGLVFDGKRVTCNAQTAFAGKSRSDSPEMKEAKEFLSAALADGARLGREVYAEAEQANISERTLKRAKSSLGVKSHRPGGAGPWIWMLEAPE